MYPAISIRITGRVQGVGFRYFVQRIANEFGVNGFVKNEPDGSVYIECPSGPNFELFLEKIRTEHPGHIEKIKIAEIKTEKYFSSFSISH